MDATTKERFDQLFRQLESNFNTFFDSYSKFSGSYILIMGWLITSDGARAFLAKQGNPISYIAMIILALLSLLYAILCRRMYRKSTHLQTMLTDLQYMEPKYFRSRSISKVSFNIILAGNIVITIALCAILMYVAMTAAPVALK